MAETTAETLAREMESSAKIAQIFSSIVFAGIVIYLVFANSTKLSFIQQAAQEKRLAVCCQISTAVAMISCFLNIFQITDVDNLVLPRREGSGYTVDLARPVEWILTCPMMQLTLVLMGGSRIPEYRRFFMPFLSAFIVSWGTLSLYVDTPWNFLCYFFGFSTFCLMTFFNRRQIMEHSNGTEGFFTGDSEFRKATLILVCTWFPFPIWYGLSPEGFNVITNILIIQMGWMLLNVISKGTSVLYIQRAKDNYISRLKVNRLMKNAQGVGGTDVNEREDNMVSASLGPCVSETMTFLGMADKSERFLRLLKDAKITNLEKVSTLTPEDCKELKLPWDLVNALQKRHRIWSLEVQDDVEEGLEKGETYYLKQSNANNSPRSLPPTQEMEPSGFPAGFQPPPPPAGSRDSLINFSFASARNLGQKFPEEIMSGPRPLVENATEEVLSKLQGIEDQLDRLANLEEKVDNGFSDMDKSLNKVVRMFEVSVDQKLDQKLDKGFQGVCRDIGKSAGECQQAIASGLQNVSRTLERSEVALEEKIQIGFNNADKRQSYISDDMQTRVAQVAESLSQQTEDIMHSSRTTLTEMGNGVDRALDNIRDSMDANKLEVLRSLDDMIQKMSHQVMTDAKSNAFTLTAKVAAVEEAQSRHCTQLASQFEKCLNEGMQSASNYQGDSAIQRISEEFRRFGEERAQHDDEISQDFARSLKEVNEHVEKHVQVGVGVISNTLRAQMDDIEEMHKETQLKISDTLQKLEQDCVDNICSKSLKQNEDLLSKLEYTLHKDLSEQKHAHEDLTTKLEFQLKKDINDHKQLSSAVLEQAAAAQFRSKECCEMVAELTDRMASHPTASSPSGVATPSGDMLRQMSPMPAPSPSPSSAVSMGRPQTAGPRRYGGSTGPGL